MFFKDYEFVQYTKDPSITEIRNNMLTITPKIENDEINLRQPLDMSSGCTKPLRQDCYYYNKNIIGPPITSGQMKSTLQFAYGRVEVKAELPKGDWIYPRTVFSIFYKLDFLTLCYCRNFS